MIYLVSMFDESYARREMEYTKRFLDFKCKRKVATCISSYEDLPIELNPNDWLVLADYMQHPRCDELIKSYGEEFDRWRDALNKLDKSKFVAWSGDTRFICNLKGVKKAISYVPMIFGRLTVEEERLFFQRYWRGDEDVRLVSWKDMLPELTYDYTLAETQVDWFTSFYCGKKEYDLIYVINGAIKHRYYQLPWLNGLQCSMLLGDWKRREEKEIIDFVQNTRANVDYCTVKVYGDKWLSLTSKGRYTFLADDTDVTYDGLLVARFWEAVRAETIPLIHLKKDKHRKIYKGFPFLETLGYFTNGDDLRRITKLQPCRMECASELMKLQKKYIWEID